MPFGCTHCATPERTQAGSPAEGLARQNICEGQEARGHPARRYGTRDLEDNRLIGDRDADGLDALVLVANGVDEFHDVVYSFTVDDVAPRLTFTVMAETVSST